MVINQHENQNCKHPGNCRGHPGADGIASERRPNGSFFEVLDARGESARAEDHRKILRRLLSEPAIDDTLIVDLFLDYGNFLDFVVEDDSQVVADVSAGKSSESTSTFPG